MLDKTSTKGKHLTIYDRTFIEDALTNGYPLNEIAKYLSKDPRTISKEVKKNRSLKESRAEFKGGCINRKSCQVKHLCSDACNKLCKSCINLNCMRKCTDFKPKPCSKLNKFPHVCNGCETKYQCKLDKYFYRSKVAEANYRDNLETSRKGINMTANELDALDKLVSPLIRMGQPIYHIYANHKDEIKCSERTLYQYIENGLLSVRNIDLRRKVKYKPRKKKTIVQRKSNHRIGKSYDDFCVHIAKNTESEVVEMDTVIGRKGGKTLLTLFFRKSSLMVAQLLDQNTQSCVIDAFDKIYGDVGTEVFKSNFPICITDNGSEFLDTKSLEYSKDGVKRTQVFYCDPMSSHQKGQLEKNHEYIRYVLPKGSSFDHLTQEKITLLMNHINSISRKSLNEKTPFELAESELDKRLLDALSLKKIDADDIYLKEELIDPTYLKRTLLDAIRA